MSKSCEKVDIKKWFPDDLCTCQIIDEFQNDYNYSDIYHIERDLKKKNKDSCKPKFLDLSNKVSQRKIKNRSFDIKGVFSFYFNRITHLSSNITSKMVY